MKEDTFCAHRDPVRGREVAHGEGLHAIYPVDVRFGPYRSQPGSGFVAKRQRPGHRRPARFVCGSPENVVEKKGADSAVYVTGGSFVGRPERHVGPDAPVGFMVDQQRGSQCVA